MRRSSSSSDDDKGMALRISVGSIPERRDTPFILNLGISPSIESVERE